MRKSLVILLIIPMCFIFLLGLVLFDYIYFPLIEFKAENAAEKHLEEKYEEDFIIEEASFSKPLGDKTGIYNIDALPKKNPDLTVHISVTEDMQPLSDDYLDMKWREELNEQFRTVYRELYGSLEKYSCMVNVFFPDEAYTKYNISNTYQDVYEQEHKNIGNIIFANVLLQSPNEMDQQLYKVYELIQYMIDKELEYFSIQIEYYNDKLKDNISAKDKKLDYNDFSNKHLNNRDYVFQFSYDSRDETSKEKLDNIKSATDLKLYLREIDW